MLDKHEKQGYNSNRIITVKEIFMKKVHFVLISIVVIVFLFVSCGHEFGTEKSGPVTPSGLSRGNDDDQGEDKGNGKKPPVVNPHEKDEEKPPEEIEIPDEDVTEPEGEADGEDEGNGENPPIVLPPDVTPPKENDKEWGNTGTFWRASFGGALQGLPFDRYIPERKIVITDTAMLHKFFADTYSLSLYNNSINKPGNGWVRDEHFSDTIAKYDETFFKSRQLVTFFITAGGGGTEFRLGGTTYTNGILNINIDYVSMGESGIAAMIEWFAIIETNKVPDDTAVYVNVTDWLGRVYTF
jgi:hypothetical protein